MLSYAIIIIKIKNKKESKVTIENEEEQNFCRDKLTLFRKMKKQS